MSNEEIRLKCLEMATGRNPDPNSSVAAAMLYEKFVVGEKSGPQPASGPTENSKPAELKKPENPRRSS